MKILHVIPSIAPRYGGPSSVIFPLVSGLKAVPGIEAEIATTDADGSGGRLNPAAIPSDFPTHIFRHNWSEQWKLSLDLNRWLRRNAKEYDLIHIHAVWSFATAAAARAAEKHTVPYIIRPAGMLSGYTWNRRGWKKWLYWNLAERRTIRRAAAFHVTSNEEAAEVNDLMQHAPVYLIANGVDDAAFTQPEDRSALREECRHMAGDLPIVLFLSRLHPKKGIVDLLLPAVASMDSPCILVIAGEADANAGDYAGLVRQAIERLGLKRRVLMPGAVAGNERWSCFDGADIFVLPSHSENFGIAVAEAMARGCPVVITDTVQSGDHVTAAGAGEVVPRDVPRLAKALDQLIDQPARRRAHSEAGKAYAAQHFRWQNIARQTVDMYRDCLARHDSTNN